MIANGWKKNPLNTVTIDHVTGFPDPNGHVLLVGNQLSNPDMYGFVFTNNMVMTTDQPVLNTGGGPTSCAYHGTPTQKFDKCFTTYTFRNNGLIGTPDTFPPSSWPSGNFFPGNASDAGFVQYNGGVDGDYRLQPKSRYKNAGSDGRDLGADMVGLETALAGVE
jgi:hypothetical protein